MENKNKEKHSEDLILVLRFLLAVVATCYFISPSPYLLFALLIYLPPLLLGYVTLSHFNWLNNGTQLGKLRFNVLKIKCLEEKIAQC